MLTMLFSDRQALSGTNLDIVGIVATISSRDKLNRSFLPGPGQHQIQVVKQIGKPDKVSLN